VNKIFIDSNIWLRLLLADHKTHHEKCCQLFNLNKQGLFKLYTSNIVLLEVYFVMNKTYRIPPKSLILDIKKIIKTRNLTLVEKSNFKKALTLHQKTGVKLADCLITTQIPPKTTICTYDKHFAKLKIKTTTPDKLVKNLLN